MEVDIAGLRLDYEDRINRKIPHPAGIWKNVVPEEEEEDQEPRRRSVVKVRLKLSGIMLTLSSRIGWCRHRNPRRRIHVHPGRVGEVHKVLYTNEVELLLKIQSVERGSRPRSATMLIP